MKRQKTKEGGKPIPFVKRQKYLDLKKKSKLCVHVVILAFFSHGKPEKPFA